MSELSFRAGSHMVVQIQLAKHVNATPIVRDYMVDDERAAARPMAARRQARG
jgi:cyclopropane-fatty-acyl-phospholipid synthase